MTQEVYGMTPFQITTAEKDIYHDTELDCIALLYYGTGAAACKAYPNCILVAACNPGDANCPAFNIQ